MLGTIYLAQGREQLAASRFNKATELGWPHHYLVQASLHMMRGDIDAAFALLKFTLTDSGTDIDPLPWIYELEKAGRYYLENPESSDLLISVVEGAPRMGIIEKTCLTLLFNLKDQFFEFFSRSINESHLWPTFVMSILWMPEYKAYVEDPRFFEIMRKDGAVELWEQRGYPDGCNRVEDSVGDRLDCSKRYQLSQDL
jgi:hypothetical protein